MFFHVFTSAVLCPAVTVTHGSVFGSTSPQTGGHYTFGSRLDIVCDYGYMTNNSQQVECLSSGRWSAAIPQCTCKCMGKDMGIVVIVITIIY